MSGSFRPDDQICVLRSYIRQREILIQGAATHVQRMQKALIQMNLQLHKVVSDITGLTGMKIIRAIVAGEHDPQTLAALKDRRIHSSTDTIAKALTGDYRPEHLFVLQQELALYDVHQQQLQMCDVQIEQCLANFPTQTQEPPPPRPGQRRKKPPGNEPDFDLHQHLYRITGLNFPFDKLLQPMLGGKDSDLGRGATGYKSWKRLITKRLFPVAVSVG